MCQCKSERRAPDHLEQRAAVHELRIADHGERRQQTDRDVQGHRCSLLGEFKPVLNVPVVNVGCGKWFRHFGIVALRPLRPSTSRPHRWMQKTNMYLNTGPLRTARTRARERPRTTVEGRLPTVTERRVGDALLNRPSPRVAAGPPPNVVGCKCQWPLEGSSTIPYRRQSSEIRREGVSECAVKHGL